MEYVVTMRRTVKWVYNVEADSEEEARMKAGEFEFVDEGYEIDQEDWEILKIEEEG